MRRIVLVVIIVAVVGLAGYMVLRPKGSARAGKRSSAAVQDSTGAKGKAKGRAVKSTAKAGKTTGTLKPMTKEQRKAEAKKLRAEERRRRRELRKQERERKRALRAASRGRSSKRGRKGQYYIVKAIVSLGSESYALIDGRRAKVGDVVMARRIVAIMPDRVEVEAFGRRSTVRVGESLLPSSYIGTKTSRRRR